MSKRKHPAIHVAATRENFRRGGHVFGTKPVTLPLAALHPDAHAAIVADRSLVVVETAVHLDEAQAAALPHHDAKHVKLAAANIDTLAPIDEDHAKRAVALADIEAELKEREADITQREAKLDQRQTELDAAADALKRAQADLDEQRSAFEAQRTALGTSVNVSAEGVAHVVATQAAKKRS